MPRKNRTSTGRLLSIPAANREALPALQRVSVEKAEAAFAAADKTGSKVYVKAHVYRAMKGHGCRVRRVDVRTIQRLERETNAALNEAYNAISSLTCALIAATGGAK